MPAPNKLNNKKNHLNDMPAKNSCPDQISIIITDMPKSGCSSKNKRIENNNIKEKCKLETNLGKYLIVLYLLAIR